MLKIRRVESDGLVTFALSGRIQPDQVSELRKLMDSEALRTVAFDLEEVRLVDREAVKFLAGCEAGGVKLNGCPPYIREWIGTGSETRL